MKLKKSDIKAYIDEVTFLIDDLNFADNFGNQEYTLAREIQKNYQYQELDKIPTNVQLKLLKDRYASVRRIIINKKIVSDREKFYSLLDHNIFVKIDPNKYTSHKKLVSCLYNSEKKKERLLELQERYMPFLNLINEKLAYVQENQSSSFFSFFLRKDIKEKIQENKTFIENNYFRLNIIRQKIDEVKLYQADSDEAVYDFNKNPHKYYQKLAILLNYPVKEADRIILRISSDIKNIKNRIKEIDKDFIDGEIKKLWGEVKEEKYQDAIANLSINILLASENVQLPPGIMKEDIETVGQFQRELKTSFDNNCIPDEEYFDLRQSIENFIKKYKKDFYPRIDNENLSETDIQVLKRIFIRKSIDEKTEDLVLKFNTLYDDIEMHRLNIAKRQLNTYEELFLNQEEGEEVAQHKRALIDSYSQLLELEQYIPNIELPKKDIFLSDFNKDSASYYAILDQIIGTESPYRPNDLPNVIVESVEKFPLNTKGLKVTLRPYQEFGSKYALTFKKTLLGDEMGLGKTIQAIAVANHLREEGKIHSIVITPLSVLTNWKREIEKWSNIEVFVFRGNIRTSSYQAWDKGGGILLLNYEQSERLLDYLANRSVDFVVVDEAHFIKNPRTKRTINTNIIAKRAEYNLFMTGTALENRLSEMQQLISILNPDIASKIENKMDEKRFKEEVSLIYLRRKRNEVLKELPEIETIELWSNFSDIEQKYYDEALIQGINGLMKMRRSAFVGKDPNKSEKIKNVIEICKEAKENDDKVIIFSYFKIVLNELKNHIGEDLVGMISGEVSLKQRQGLVDRFREADKGAVLLSQIDAGGVGLNIQVANVVILCEPQYKPSTENQAIGRVYRMGQTKNVIVYRLLTEESIDESLLELLGEKTDIFNRYAQDSNVSDAFTQYYNGRGEISETKLENKVFEMEKQRYEMRKNHKKISSETF